MPLPTPVPHLTGFPKDQAKSLQISLIVLLRLDCSEIYAKSKSEDGEDENDDGERPPLQLPCTPGRSDALVKVYICLLGVLVHLSRLLIDLGDLGLLVDDLLVQLRE
jgi:hypothetical protein